MPGRILRLLLTAVLAISICPPQAYAVASAIREAAVAHSNAAVHIIAEAGSWDSVSLLEQAGTVFGGVIAADGGLLDPTQSTEFLQSYIKEESSVREKRAALQALSDPELRGQILAAAQEASESKAFFTAEMGRSTAASIRRFESAFAALDGAKRDYFLASIPVLQQPASLAPAAIRGLPNSREILARAAERGVELGQIAEAIQTSGTFEQVRDKLEDLGVLRADEHNDPNRGDWLQFAVHGLWYETAPHAPNPQAPLDTTRRIPATVVNVGELQFPLNVLDAHILNGEEKHVRRLVRRVKREGGEFIAEHNFGKGYRFDFGKQTTDHDVLFYPVPVQVMAQPPVQSVSSISGLRVYLPAAIRLSAWALIVASAYLLYLYPAAWQSWAAELGSIAMAAFAYRPRSFSAKLLSWIDPYQLIPQWMKARFADRPHVRSRWIYSLAIALVLIHRLPSSRFFRPAVVSISQSIERMIGDRQEASDLIQRFEDASRWQNDFPDFVDHNRRMHRATYRFRPKLDELDRLVLPMPLRSASRFEDDQKDVLREQGIALAVLDYARRAYAESGRKIFSLLYASNHYKGVAWYLQHPEEAVAVKSLPGQRTYLDVGPKTVDSGTNGLIRRGEPAGTISGIVDLSHANP